MSAGAAPAVLPAPRASLVVSLRGFEGPLDVLLDLARRRKLDLKRLPILPLAEQYLAFVVAAKERHLEVAAEYLVMAAWLAYLKSRLLLPEPEPDAPDPDAMAEGLALRLRRLDALRRAADELGRRPLLGRERRARGAAGPPRPRVERRTRARLPDLLRAYAALRARAAESRLTVEAPPVFTVERALRRITSLLGGPDWRHLAALLPDAADDLARRSALASALAASLELARDGRLELRQDRPFGPVLVRPVPRRAGPAPSDEPDGR